MIRPFAPAVLAVVATASVAILASQGGQGGAFAEAQAANKTRLHEYTWKSRTELKMKGESKNVKLEQVRYDVNGELQKTPIGGTPEPPPAPPARGRGSRLKKRVVENKKEEFGELMQQIVALVTSYAHLPPDKARTLGAGATKDQATGEMVLRAANLLRAGDSLTVRVAPDMMMRQVEVATVLEDKPVSLTALYQVVADGPTAMARAVLRYPDKQVEVTVDSFDYQRVGR